MISNKGILPCKLISEKYFHLREHNITNNWKLLVQITSTQRARYIIIMFVWLTANATCRSRLDMYYWNWNISLLWITLVMFECICLFIHLHLFKIIQYVCFTLLNFFMFTPRIFTWRSIERNLIWNVFIVLKITLLLWGVQPSTAPIQDNQFSKFHRLPSRTGLRKHL